MTQFAVLFLLLQGQPRKQCTE